MTKRPDSLEAHPCRARDEYRTLFEHMRDTVFFVCVRDGRILQANPAAEALYGFARETLLTMRIYDLVATSDGAPPAPPDATRGSQITPEGALFETVHRRADGSTIPVEVNARVIESAEEPYIVAVIRDISERAASERALRRAHAEMERIFETAADGMRVVDREATVVRANQTLIEMTGLTREQVVGAKCSQTFSGDDCGTGRCPLGRADSGAGRLADEVVKTRADGSEIECLRTVVPFVVDGEFVGIIESFRDITERKRVERLAEYHATHDALTGLPNRLLFGDRIESALLRARREGTRPALLYCDVDGFKEVNDTLGHGRGDEVLRSVARLLTASVRESDTVARIGGDEFVVLLADAGEHSSAAVVAGKILAALETHGVKVSVGIAHFREGDDADALLRRADAAMYRVKGQGGAGYLAAAAPERV